MACLCLPMKMQVTQVLCRVQKKLFGGRSRPLSLSSLTWHGTTILAGEQASMQQLQLKDRTRGIGGGMGRAAEAVVSRAPGNCRRCRRSRAVVLRALCPAQEGPESQPLLLASLRPKVEDPA